MHDIALVLPAFEDLNYVVNVPRDKNSLKKRLEAGDMYDQFNINFKIKYNYSNYRRLYEPAGRPKANMALQYHQKWIDTDKGYYVNHKPGRLQCHYIIK
jgi:hypothetical protein